MEINELNQRRKKLYIDNDNIKDIINYHELGIYKWLFMLDPYNNNAMIGDKYLDECDNNEIINYVRSRLDYFKKRYNSYYLSIDSFNLSESYIDLLNILSKDIPILISLKNYKNTNFDIVNSILNKYGDNVFIEDDADKHSLEQLDCILKSKKNNKFVKYAFDDKQNQHIYMPGELNKNDSLNILIENTDDLKSVITKLNTVSQLYADNIISNPIININISDIRFFKVFNQIIGEFETNEKLPGDKVVYNLNVEKVENQINYRDTRNFGYLESQIHIKAHGMEFDDYGEFQHYHNFTKFLLSKIPKNSTDIEKVIYISKIIVRLFNYDDNNYEKELTGEGSVPNRSLYEFISGGVGVCCDYAKLTKYLLNEVGIKCDFISSETYDYKKYISSLEKEDNNQPVNEDYFGHAFNIVYIDNKPYYLDNTWIDDSKNLFENTNFLVSTKTFSLYHSAYVELENYNCPQDYNRMDIYKAEEKVENSCFNYSEEDVNFLTSIRLDTIANTFRDSVKKR